MRALLVALSVTDPASLRAALSAALRDLAAGFGGVLDVEEVDGLAGRVTLHVPRAFVVSHAA